MGTFIYADLPDEQRQEVLKNLSVKQETKEFARSLSEGEAAAENLQYTREAMHLKGIEEEKRKAIKEYGFKISSLETAMDERLAAIAAGKRNVTESVYLIPNFEKGIMYFVSSRGEVVGSRQLEASERQAKLFLPAGQDRPDLPEELNEITEDIEHVEVDTVEGEKEDSNESVNAELITDDDLENKSEKPFERPLMAPFDEEKKDSPKKGEKTNGKKGRPPGKNSKKVPQSPEHPSGEVDEE